MNEPRRVLLLVGSPRGPRSTSESLGAYLLKKLQGYGLELEKVYIHPSLRSDEGRGNLLRAVDSSDLLILAFPLYVDSLPSPVIAALEMIAEHRKTSKKQRSQRFLAISNNGFPEACQNDTALAICRRFASETGIEWVGGLALGGGEAVRGKPLDEAGGRVRNVKKALDLAAAALAEGKSVPKEAEVLMAKAIVPVWMYVWFGNRGWKRQAKKYGAQNKLRDRPYQK